MGISEEIEDATIAIDETKISEIEATKRRFRNYCVQTPGGYSIYPLVGRCGRAPHTLTLFKTNIADFPILFKTEFRFLIPCLRHLTRI